MGKEKVESVDQRVMFKPLTESISNYLLKVNKHNKNNRKSIYSNCPKSIWSKDVLLAFGGPMVSLQVNLSKVWAERKPSILKEKN